MPFSDLAPSLSAALAEPRSLALFAAAYALGSVSGSLVLGKLRGVDIRTQGSGNAGGTNALRTQGARFAYAPVGDGLSVTAHGYLAAFAAVLGHVWPLWHGFRGGKGVATLVGGLLVLWPFVVPALLLVWGATIALSGYVGLASVIAALSLPLLAWYGDAGAPRLWFCVAAAALVLFTHRGNLARLRAGTESRFARARLLHRWRRG